MNFLTDPAWLAVIVAVIGIFLTVIKRKNLKGIVYDIASNTPVLNIGEEVKGKVQVLHNGKLIDDVRIIVIRLWNYRDATIHPTDYILPFTFDFGLNAEVLDIEVLDETDPLDLKKELRVDVSVNKVIFKPVLLHGKDSIKFKVLVTKFDKLEVSARINGVRQIITSEELLSKKLIRAVKTGGALFEKILLISFIPLVLAFIIFFLTGVFVFRLSPEHILTFYTFVYYLPFGDVILFVFFIYSFLSLIALIHKIIDYVAIWFHKYHP